MDTFVESHAKVGKDSYTFGADFYTEMFGVTYDADENIVRNGKTIAVAANQISDNQYALAEVIKTAQSNTRKMTGICIALIGLIVLFVCDSYDVAIL